MGLFSRSKKDRYLGVDIGASGIKIVELGKRKGRPTLLTYGYTEVPAGQTRASLLEDTRSTGELLAKLCKQSGVESKSAMTALPISSIFSTIVSVPYKEKKKEMKPLIDAQVAKLTPLPLDEMITYSTFIDGNEKKAKGKKKKKQDKKNPKNVRVLVTGAARSLVQKYVEIFKYAKLDLDAIDTESFALVRSLIGKDRSSILILDMGMKRSNVTVVEKGIPFLTRSINIGGDNVTKRIKEQMNLDRAQAEQVKRDLSAPEGGTDLPGGLPPVLESVMKPIVHEIRYALELYQNMELTELKQVEKIVLTGGSSSLPRLPEYIAQTLNMNAYRGDPWARLRYPRDLRAVLDEIGSRMSVAVGLAMRDLE